MKTKLIEATSNRFNWGKFVLARFEEHELAARSAVDGTPLVLGRGWTTSHLWILDLATGEGAYFAPTGLAKYDLDKHRIWVCPLFEPFLVWLRTQDLTDLSLLPSVVDLPQAPNAMHGYRRTGV